nr:putative membrane protein [Emiliania huxleyi virus 86]
GVVSCFILYRMFVTTSENDEKKFIEGTVQQETDPSKILQKQMSRTSRRVDGENTQMSIDQENKHLMAMRIRAADARVEEQNVIDMQLHKAATQMEIDTLKKQKELDGLMSTEQSLDAQVHEASQKLKLAELTTKLERIAAEKDAMEARKAERQEAHAVDDADSLV